MQCFFNKGSGHFYISDKSQAGSKRVMTAIRDEDIFQEISCGLCRETNYQVVYPGSPQAKPGPDSVKITDGQYQVCGQIVRCNGCGLVYVNPQLVSEKLVSLYSEMEDPTYHVEASGRKVAFRRILKQLERLRRCDSSPVRLLDVGAATGLLLEEAEKLGWYAVGVEPSKWAARVASEEHGLQVHCGTLDNCPFEKKSFDFITAVDVLEHVSDPRGLLEEFHNWLKPDGIACVVTPDFESLAARVLKQKWWHIRQAHQYYFSEHTLARMIESTNYEAVKKKRYGWTFSVDYWASRFENFNRHVFAALQFVKHKTFLRSVFKWNVGINFRDSFEWYLKSK